MIRCLPLLLLAVLSCSDPQPNQTKDIPTTNFNIPAPNTVVASDSMRIPDALNELYYSIEVVTTSQSRQGVYEVLVQYGYNEASTRITMPASEHPLIPVLKKNAPNEYIIGFRIPEDNTFKDYFLVRANKGRIEMKYLKAYFIKP